MKNNNQLTGNEETIGENCFNNTVDSEELKNKSKFGFIWKLFEKSGVQIASMVIQIVLARLLLPDDYGIIAYLTLFINLSDVFIKQGLTTALIQKKNSDDKDFSSVFYANIVFSVLLYAILYFSAPYVSIFYNEPRLTSVMRILSLQVVIGALGSVHEAIMSRNLQFKKSFIRGLANIIVYGASGIAFAYLGLGVWALVYGRLCGLFVGMVVLWITVRWRPKLIFSMNRLKGLFSFGSKVLGTNLLNTLFNDINSLIIGRNYSSADLAQYQRGQNIPQTMMVSIDGSINEVMYPTFSKLQDDVDSLKKALRRAIKLSIYIVLPCLIGLLAVAEPLTLLLLTEKWLPSVPYMQLTCLICMFWPLSSQKHALNALGKSSVTFKMSLIVRVITLAFLLVLIKFGIIYIMLGTIFVSIIDVLITSFFTKKYINYSLKNLICDLFPTLFITAVMGIVVYLVNYLNLSPIISLIIQIPVGVVIYLALSAIFKIDSFSYFLNTIKEILRKKTK